jgi:predicted adenine nucleotide alpha hydrolase (AANH) superfamily ATPase
MLESLYISKSKIRQDLLTLFFTNPTLYSLEEYRSRKKAKSSFIIELLKGPKIMLIGREDDL